MFYVVTGGVNMLIINAIVLQNAHNYEKYQKKLRNFLDLKKVCIFALSNDESQTQNRQKLTKKQNF